MIGGRNALEKNVGGWKQKCRWMYYIHTSETVLEVGGRKRAVTKDLGFFLTIMGCT